MKLDKIWHVIAASMVITYSHWTRVVLSAENERYFITHVLAFFAGSDGIVMENLAGRFMSGKSFRTIHTCEVQRDTV